MLTIETKELEISVELKRKVDMICKFAGVKAEYQNGNVKSISSTNLVFLLFEQSCCVIIPNKKWGLHMKNNKYFENMSIWKIFAIAIFIYIIVSLTSYVSDKTYIFVESLVPVFSLILYYVCEYFLGRRSR